MRRLGIYSCALALTGGLVSACGSRSPRASDAGADSAWDAALAVDAAAGADGDVETSTDSGQAEPEPPLPCPAPLAAPRVTGCDGIDLADPTSIESKSEGITSGMGPGGSQALSIGNGQSIDLTDEGCLQLGKAGSDFSLSLWLKAAGSSQIIGTTSQYSQAQGFVLATSLRSDGDLELVLSSAPTAGPMLRVVSAPFKPNGWVHVGLRYDNQGEASRMTIDVNMATRSGQAAADVYNDKLRIGDEGWGDIQPFEIAEVSSFGRVLSDRELKALFLGHAEVNGVSPAELTLALERLQAHVDSKASLTASELETETARFVRNSVLLDTDTNLMRTALALVHSFEAQQGPLFMTEATKNGFARIGTDGDGLELVRSMAVIQQAVLETVFTPTNVQHCASEVLADERFETADYFPGRAVAPSEPLRSYEVTVSASAPAFWGRPVAFADAPVRRPTGLYLSPGSIAEVTVASELINAGYSVLVGAHTADHSNKSTLKRLDRVSLTFPITSKVTKVASPLGGGVYIVVPYLADLGLVKVSIRGVIEAPFFSMKSFDQTNLEQWKERRTAPGPWADFETDKFMMQVPSSWIYAYDDPKTLLLAWDKAMDGVSELMGFPPEKRNRTVLYQQVDVQIRHNVFGIGYPQVNNTYDPSSTSDAGNSKHWLLTDPTRFEVDYHELGHAQLMSMFRGETEAIVNFPHAYVQHAKFGVDFEQAFQESFGPAYGALGMSPDDAAINWMITDNFRNSKEMDYSNSSKNEFRYQQRGYAKYADLYRVFGWDAVRNFYHQEHLDYMAKTPSDGLHEVDSRILRLSVAAGADVTPLIHFWGIHPVDPALLKQKLASLGIGPSQALRAHLQRYKTMAPANNADFNEHFERVFPGRPTGGNPDYGVGWYNTWRDVFNETHAAQIQTTIDQLLALYF